MELWYKTVGFKHQDVSSRVSERKNGKEGCLPGVETKVEVSCLYNVFIDFYLVCKPQNVIFS